MKTTKLSAERVLIGLLVISIVGLVAYGPANPIVVLNNKDAVDLILTGGLLSKISRSALIFTIDIRKSF